MNNPEKIIQFTVSVPANTDVCIIDMGRRTSPQGVDNKEEDNIVRLSLCGEQPEKRGGP